MEGGCYEFDYIKRTFITPNSYSGMRPETNDGVKRIEKYLLENAAPEVKPIH